MSIDPASVDTNHAERDKHLRNPDFLDVEKYPDAGFESTKYTGDAESGTLEGMLTLHGVTKPISIELRKLGEGKDPWGGYRAGFIGTVTLTAETSGSATTSARPARRWSWSSASRAFGSRPLPCGAFGGRMRRDPGGYVRSLPSSHRRMIRRWRSPP